jgi:chemotaxis regulatin CheY-phosphate phosphatase CheZ
VEQALENLGMRIGSLDRTLHTVAMAVLALYLQTHTNMSQDEAIRDARDLLRKCAQV